MSLVQAFIYKDFIVVGGEKKATLQGGIVVDNFNKVVKLNEVIIIGMKYDKSINNNISFEKIRKIDVCGN